MGLDHPGDMPIRFCPRIAAHAQPFTTRPRDARFHERVGIVPTSKQPDDAGVDESVFILILTDDDMHGHGFLHLVRAIAVSLRQGHASVYPGAAPDV
jgi:hypothetical protein